MIRGALLDLAGVVFDGDRAIGGSAEAIARLRKTAIPLCFLTNTTRQPRRVILDKLRSFGIRVEPAEILTPAAAACAWLKSNGHVPHLLVHPDLAEDFAECPTRGPAAVVIGDAGRGFTYDHLNDAFRHLIRGAPFLALAANRVFRDAGGELSLDAGAFVRALEFSSEREALLLGKPAPAFFHAAAASLGCEPTDVVMIGDDAESDVAGALEAGLGKAILVRTGKYRPGDEIRFAPEPSQMVDDLAAAVDMLIK